MTQKRLAKQVRSMGYNVLPVGCCLFRIGCCCHYSDTGVSQEALLGILGLMVFMCTPAMYLSKAIVFDFFYESNRSYFKGVVSVAMSCFAITKSTLGAHQLSRCRRQHLVCLQVYASASFGV